MRQQSGPSLPPPPPLRGAELGTFAHDTVVRRLPAIGRRVLEENDLTPKAARAVTALVDELPHGQVRPLQDNGAPDLAMWEGYLAPYLGQNWLEVPWFFAETYFYRRVLEATGYFQPGPGHLADPFALQKRLGLEQTGLGDEVQRAALPLEEALLAALWGNQADMSVWPVGEGGPEGAHLLADDMPAALALIERLTAEPRPIIIILDNAGTELVRDLTLVDALLARGLPVILHAKVHPTFVSDALESDIHSTIAWLATHSAGAALGARLQAALETGQLRLRSDWYWTSPLAGWELPDPLYDELATAGLLISKGDANYRRWLGDRHWPFDTPLASVLAYAPAPLLLLRTSKSEVAAGLDPARVAEIAAQDAGWQTSGRWGLIQLVAG